ncbi:uroporphyrinogen III synthase [Massilia sp. RP-1-19]|uniref:Uroporphyrinogen-III synthase n=1 Tax=Massilia polaris TaxID=2728846 RepID=A0A848HIR6_9BURK|nr:uroporphyrinogen-III synthase [Massilia polaris]NML61756.1 uroporphyrinogen III synthase [Massilia polaris]
MSDTVVITRPRAQCEGLARAVEALGRKPVLLPLLEISPLDDHTALRAELAGLDAFAMVAFVSPNAIDAAFAFIDQWPAGVTIAVVGEGSRAALARHGLTDANATIVSPRDPSRSDSENLLQALDLGALAGQRVLIVRGQSGRELMADGLRAAGATVSTVAAYRRSVPPMTPELAATLAGLIAAPKDWIITSSEALRGLMTLLHELDPEAAVAKMQQQHLIVPHARIAETANTLGLTRLTLTGSGDERLLAALQSQR